MPTCIKWGVERHQECFQTADQGYNECSTSEDRGHSECCTWWPCSWLCDALVWIANVVCVVWTWVGNVVCVAWTWITTAICVLWDVVMLLANGVFFVLEGIFGGVLSAIAALIELIEAIPFVGPVIRFIINAITTAVSVIFGVFDLALGLVGIRPEKKLRICTIILRDETGAPLADPGSVVSALQLAADVYKRDANVRLMPLGLFQYRQGFDGADAVGVGWVQTDPANSAADVLDYSCTSPDAASLLGTPASSLQWKMTSLCFVGAWRRVTGYGAPVTAFIVRNISGAIGCNNPLDDFIRINGVGLSIPAGKSGLPPESPRTIGHELGHACLLTHRCVDEDVRNLMGTGGACDPDSPTNSDRANPRLSDWQALVIRSSKHASYF